MVAGYCQHPEESAQYRHIGGGVGQGRRYVQPYQQQSKAGGSTGSPAEGKPAFPGGIARAALLDARLDTVRQLGWDGDLVVVLFRLLEFIHESSTPSKVTRSFFKPAYRRLFTVLTFCPVTWLISFKDSSS